MADERVKASSRKQGGDLARTSSYMLSSSNGETFQHLASITLLSSFVLITESSPATSRPPSLVFACCAFHR